MDQERLDAYANWLRTNKDKAGSPEFVKVAEAYRGMREGPKPFDWAPEWVQKGANAVTRSTYPVKRAVTGAATLPYDLPAAVYNMAKNRIAPNAPTAPMAGPALRRALDVPEMPEDAGWLQKIGEAGLGMALLGPGAASVLTRAAPAAAAPAVAAAAPVSTAPISLGAATREGAKLVGGVVGSEIGAQYSPELALAGGILGGGGAGMVGNAMSRPFSILGGPNAGEVYDAGQRIGARVTAGEVGNGGVKWMEKSLGALPFAGARVNAAREQSLRGMENARDRAAGMIGGGQTLGVEAGQRGETLVAGARAAESRIQRALSAEQEALERAIGSATPVNVRGAVGISQGQARGTDMTNAGPILTRAQQLEDMMPTGAFARDPTAPVGTVPYGVVKDFRTNLNTRTEGLDPVPRHLQQPIADEVTRGMRETARFRGQEQAFDTANTNYARMQEPLGSLRQVAGDYDPSSGAYRNGMTGGQAENLINRGLTSPEVLAPFADHIDPRAWNYIAGSTVARMGQQARGGTFRPDNFAMEWGGPGQTKGVNPGSAALLSQSAPQAQTILDDVATLGRAYNIPPQEQGLSRAIGGLTMASWLGNKMTNAGGLLAAPVLVGPGALLESGPVVRGLAGRAIPMSEVAQMGLPGMLAGAVYALPPEARQ